MSNSLKHCVSVYIPGTQNVDQLMTPEQQKIIARQVLQQFARQFGGASSRVLEGCYIASDAEAVFETIIEVYAFCSDVKAAREYVEKVAANLRDGLGQECVTVVVDGEMTWI